ncbi:hypothetical protein HYC85_016546 [Camellia sinensis]|uniref:Leucine-rich repeat-containing N-terminal plant-type domain-containing protein n=1 Tax=Camellia sinensis TaxID=4442 RepID=A0A7J7H3N4_CAMSI|nr:hypothetical protein HYC85_016546 [Camellia sinensis]
MEIHARASKHPLERKKQQQGPARASKAPLKREGQILGINFWSQSTTNLFQTCPTQPKTQIQRVKDGNENETTTHRRNRVWNTINKERKNQDRYKIAAMVEHRDGSAGFYEDTSFNELMSREKQTVEDQRGAEESKGRLYLDVGGRTSDAVVAAARETLHLSGLDGLKHLQELYLDYSSIDKIFLHNVGVMSSLRVLTLRNISLNGSLPNQGWCELSNLQELDLSENGFTGMLPTCLGDLTSIRILDHSFNQFIGNLTSSPLSNLTTLEYLILSYNHSEIPVSFISFCNHSKIKVFLGDNNKLSDQIEFQTWIPKFQLKVFSLSNCGSSNLGMKFPHFLFYQYDLRIVDLSHNSVRTFPVWLLENNTRLEVFHLINCSFMGPFLLPSYPNPHAISIDISDNHLEGPIPTNIGSIFPNLLNLKTSSNLIQGHIPTSLGDMHSLEFLNLSNNNLSGQIPKHLTIVAPFYPTSYYQTIICLAKYLFHWYAYIWTIIISAGKFPDSISIPPLEALGISKNHMSGKLPRWMGNMSNLMGIAMFSNHFEGPIPVEFCKLDLSKNNLSGSILSCFNQLRVKHVHLNQN